MILDTNIEMQQVNPMPRIGDNSPDFEAVTTKGKIKFSECAKGKWVPLDWKKGDKVIDGPPKKLDELNARLADDSLKKVDWYLAKKDL